MFRHCRVFQHYHRLQRRHVWEHCHRLLEVWPSCLFCSFEPVGFQSPRIFLTACGSVSWQPSATPDSYDASRIQEPFLSVHELWNAPLDPSSFQSPGPSSALSLRIHSRPTPGCQRSMSEPLRTSARWIWSRAVPRWVRHWCPSEGCWGWHFRLFWIPSGPRHRSEMWSSFRSWMWISVVGRTNSWTQFRTNNDSTLTAWSILDVHRDRYRGQGRERWRESRLISKW